jgi:hypothetical protein
MVDHVFLEYILYPYPQGEYTVYIPPYECIYTPDGKHCMCTIISDSVPHSWFRGIFYECCDCVNVCVHTSMDPISLRSSIWSAKR